MKDVLNTIMDQTDQSKINSGLFDNLRETINVIDDLRDVGLQEYIQLPRIIVVGSQSSGKSSLLENVVGLDFLPRGSGVVTRRPLEMRLVHIPPSREKVKPWATFEDYKDASGKQIKFDDFDVVRTKIEELTDKVAGKKQGIVNIPIVMTIYSNECPDLTMVDLPGITRISIKGSDQQDVDIEKVTKDMIRDYAKDERTIMLVVSPANADITNSDGLQLARQIDPQGKRTIGVITKIDIMDRGTDARSLLMGHEVPLELGYVGVVNRSQQDINDKKRVKAALEAEREYFSKNPVYSMMDPKYLGTQALTTKLTTIFFEHIKNNLPKIAKEIQEKIDDCEARLKELGPAMPEDSKDKMHLVWEKITEFTENFKNAISGKYDAKRGTNLKSDLSGGAIIKMMFNELYDEISNKDYQASKEYKDKDIDRSIILHQGDSIPGFPSIDSFLYLINPLLDRLKEPAQETLTQVYNYLETLSQKLIKKVFAQFPGLIDQITEISSRVLQECRDKAKQIVDNIIDGEQGYLFTNDQDYLNHQTHLIPQQQQDQEGKLVDAKKVFIKELRSRVDTYFKIVVRNMRDSIPKAIGYFLVKQSQDQMQYVLYNEMMQREESMDLLKEPPIIKQERDTISKTLSVLKKASKVLKRDPNLSTGYRVGKE